jgi:DivIVA domain-containing protein
VALERQTIEKKDFPIGRRGYDPDAVDQHLRALADEIERLKGSSPRQAETLASSASDRVRAIVEAAETSAAEIQRQAEEEAREVRSEADREARDTREDAAEQAREYLGRVSESTAGMLKRVDAMESELGALLEALRTGANRLNADLQLLDGNIGDVRESMTPRASSEAELPAPAVHRVAEVEEPLAPAAGGFEPDEPEIEDEPFAPAGSAPAEGSGDTTESARLVALEMALKGTPREETERYLAENFGLSDPGALIEKVYASVGE